ncbi:MAG: hypothetical protein M3N52_11905 [Actinomycetota bacterium]|nr:hypothetical protein [Actinomycetota bacterium]
MDVGLNVKPTEYDQWFPLLPGVRFCRVFSGPGRGLPNLSGGAIRRLPPGCLPHISHKDEVPIREVEAFWSALPAAPPCRRYRWTFRHEGEDYDRARYHAYWRELRKARDGHPRCAEIELVAIHTLYASRYKVDVEWRRWMLPGVADTDGWDCYPPTAFPSYEPPESLFGLPVAAAREFGMPLSIPEWGATLRGGDTGARRARWFAEGAAFLGAQGCTAVGLWCSYEKTNGRSYDYRPDGATLAVWQEIVAAHA